MVATRPFRYLSWCVVLGLALNAASAAAEVVVLPVAGNLPAETRTGLDADLADSLRGRSVAMVPPARVAAEIQTRGLPPLPDEAACRELLAALSATAVVEASAFSAGDTVLLWVKVVPAAGPVAQATENATPASASPRLIALVQRLLPSHPVATAAPPPAPAVVAPAPAPVVAPVVAPAPAPAAPATAPPPPPVSVQPTPPPVRISPREVTADPLDPHDQPRPARKVYGMALLMHSLGLSLAAIAAAVTATEIDSNEDWWLSVEVIGAVYTAVVPLTSAGVVQYYANQNRSWQTPFAPLVIGDYAGTAATYGAMLLWIELEGDQSLGVLTLFALPVFVAPLGTLIGYVAGRQPGETGRVAFNGPAPLLLRPAGQPRELVPGLSLVSGSF